MERKIKNEIDRYIHDEMTEAEYLTFEKEMEENESLRKEVEFEEMILAGIRRKDEIEALKAIRDASEEEIERLIEATRRVAKQNVIAASPPIKNRALLFGVTTVAAVLLAFIYIGFQPKYSSEKLFNEYYLYEIYEATPSRGIEADKEQERLLAELNASIDFLNVDKPKDAIEKLLPILSSPKFEFRQEAEWYLALSYLKDNQRDKAEEVLAKIGTNNSDYAGKAKALSDKLEKRKWFGK